MAEEIILDMLTLDSVSVKTINLDGLIHRKAYINSEKGRGEVIKELSIEIQNEIFYIWGGVATIIEPESEPIDTTPQPPTDIEVLQKENLLLKAQVQANTNISDFHEELIVEMAMMVYQ